MSLLLNSCGIIMKEWCVNSIFTFVRPAKCLIMEIKK